MKKRNREIYEAPFTKRSHVEMESGICASSKISIKKEVGNVEVDEYNSIENDVTFE